MAQRIAFIYPSKHNELYESDLLYSPLALAYVGAYTPDYYQMDLYDEYVDDFVDPDKVKADLVVMSAMTPNIRRAYYLADKFREKGIQTICGGAHVSALPDEALEHFDCIVKGEAEPVWPQVMKDFEAGKLKPIYDGGMAAPIDDIRLPNRDLVHPNYHYTSYITSKGCPFNCDYCYLSVFDKKKYRVLPVEAIIEDMERNRKNNDKVVIMVDENISGYCKKDYENRMLLFEEMIRRKYKFMWGAQSTIDVYKKPELLKLMAKANCRGLFVGLEAPDNFNLKNEVNKGFADRIDYKKAIKVIHKNNIAIIGSFIIGMGEQDINYARSLPKYMKKLNVEYPRLFYLTAWPGTALYNRMKKEDRILEGWDHVRKDIPSMQYKKLSFEEIQEAKQYVFDEMFSLGYLLKIIFRWLFRKPKSVWFFIKIATRNIFSKKMKEKIEEQKQKEKYIIELLDKHFENKNSTKTKKKKAKTG